MKSRLDSFKIFVIVAIIFLLIWRITAGAFYNRFAQNNTFFELIFVIITYVLIAIGFYIGYTRIQSSKMDEISKEQDQQTMEAIVVISGIIMIVTMIFISNRLLSDLNGIIGLLMILVGVYLQIKKPRNNEYVSKNIKYYIFLFIMGLIGFLLINYFDFSV